MEGVGGAKDEGYIYIYGRGQGWRVWEGPGIEGVGGAKDEGYGRGQG